VLAEGLVAAHYRGQRLYEAELYWLNGELLQAIPDAQEAEACFRRASEIARQQQAKSMELRAAMSLTRLWQQQGKRAAHPYYSHATSRQLSGPDEDRGT
jgi:tetratricopeptide (TPR) repeat protein